MLSPRLIDSREGFVIIDFTLSKAVAFERPAQNFLLVLKKERLNIHFKRNEKRLMCGEYSFSTDLNGQIPAEKI